MTEGIDLRSRTNRLSGAALYVFSSVALITVVTSYFERPLPDEGAAAHIFQLSVVAFAAAFVTFLATVDWKRRSGWRALGISALILAAAFAGLYYLEHVFYVTHFH